MRVKAALSAYFQRLEEFFQSRRLGLPKVCVNEDAEQFIYKNVDDEGWAEWAPIEKSSVSTLEPLEKELGVKFPEAISEYFNSFWFCSLEGHYQRYTFHLAPVLPGIELEDFSDWTRNHAKRYGAGWAVIGFDMTTSASLLVNLATGSVNLQTERFSTSESWAVIAPDLETLVAELDLR